jgi:DNA-binding GntR family transcriptional regulator
MSSVRQAVARGVGRKRVKSVALTEEPESDLSSSDRVVEHVTSNILAGRYVPGQRLVEADLTHSLQVSRGPVREAFRRLDALGILTRTMHRGACVRTLARAEAEDLLLAVEPLSALMARLAAERFATRAADFDAGRFERELKPFRDREEDLANLLIQRRHFYDVLVAIGGNTALPSLIPTMRIHLLRVQIQSFLDSEDRRQHLDDYAAVARAVWGGDAKAAEKAMSAHLRHGRATVTQLPDAAFPRPVED